MTKQNDGGPAFPKANKYPCEQNGMTLRDYFAGQALPQAVAHEIALQGTRINPGGFRYADVAHAAYVMADVMLAEREKGGA